MTPPRWFLRVFWAVDKAVSRLSGGRVTLPNGTRGRLRTLFIHTIGRSTGRPRRNGLYYLEDGPNLIVIASNAGDDTDPAWWRNLQAHPDAEVELGSTRRTVRARAATPDEAGPIFERFVRASATFDEYRRRSTRPIPVVILEPR